MVVLIAATVDMIDVRPAKVYKIRDAVQKDTANNSDSNIKTSSTAEHDDADAAEQKVNGFEDMQNLVDSMGRDQENKASIFPVASRLRFGPPPGESL
jgi:hypothetical protein